MPRHFVEITRDEMDDLLIKELGLNEIGTNGMGGETTYTHTYVNGDFIRVYSSLPSRSETTRALGLDAIRIVVFKKQYNNLDSVYLKAGKVQRIATWRNNLAGKVGKAIIKFGLGKEELLNRCVVCGAEPNGLNDQRRPICAYHQTVPLATAEGFTSYLVAV